MNSQSSRSGLAGRLPWVIAAVISMLVVATISFALGRGGQSGTDVAAGATTSTITVPATSTTIAPSTTTTRGRLTAPTSAAPSQRTTQASPRATTPMTQRVLLCPAGVMVARNARIGVVEPNINFRTVEVLVDLTNETNAEVYMLTLGVRYIDNEHRSEVSVGDNQEDPNRGKFAPGQRKTYRATIIAFGDVTIRGVSTETFGLWQGEYLGRQECGYPKLEAR